MRIAQIAPMYESVPPNGYGGTERVVWSLCEELVQRGHEVTLFASGESQTNAHLVATTPQALRHRMSRFQLDDIAPWLHLEMVSRVYQRSAEFDIIHSHVDDFLAGFPFARLTQTPTVTTIHHYPDQAKLAPVLVNYPEAPVVSISMAQRTALPDVQMRWVGCVYNGIPLDHFPFHDTPGDYLAFLGRICPDKRPDWAVEVAVRSGLPLKVAAKIDPVDEDYWADQIRPLFKKHEIEFLGEVSDQQKAELLGNAYATLFPIDWMEPFGLVMTESLACGTPVIAINRGSVPEVLRHGVSGWICESVDEMVTSVPRVATLDREACRSEAERFSSTKMAEGYETIYASLL